MKLTVVFKIVVAATALLFIFSLWHRQPDIDDAWIGEHAYWMAKEGFVKSELMHGITGQHIRHIVHHKFFTLLGAGFIKVFGFSLYSLKSVSLAALIVFLLIFIRYLNKNFSKDAVWLGILLITVNALVFQYAFVYRPEIVVMTFGFASFIFLEKAMLNPLPGKYLIFSGLLAGLAAATHLNGIIYISAGGLILLFNRRPLAALIFGVSAIPAAAVYFYDFTREYNFSYWMYQIADAPALHKVQELPEFLSFLDRPFREQRRFLHSPKEISMTALLIFALIVSRKKFLKISFPGLYLLLLVLSLMIFSVHSTTKYLLLYVPVIMVIVVRSLAPLLDKVDTEFAVRQQSTRLKYWAILLLTIYLGIQTYWNINNTISKYNPSANRELAVRHFGNETQNLNVLAPMNFIFNEIENFNRIQGDLGFADMQKLGIPIHGKYLLKYSDSLNLDYLIITNEFRESFGMDTLTEQQRNLSGFVTVTRNDEYEILKNRNE